MNDTAPTQASESSLPEATKELRKFLKRTDPWVLAIKGKWGCGKTELFLRTIRSMLVAEKRKFIFCRRSPFVKRRFSYVSAANCGSLKELKQEIISFSVNWTKADATPTFCNYILRTPSTLLTPIFGLLTSVSLGAIDYYSFNRTLKFSLVLILVVLTLLVILLIVIRSVCERIFLDLGLKDCLICIDDIERTKDFPPHEVLHLVSWLRDRRNCKVCLLFNEQHLFPKGNTDEKKELSNLAQSSIEKACNQVIELRITPQEAIDIGQYGSLDSEWRKYLNEAVKLLKLSNIRVIRHLYDDLGRWKDLFSRDASEMSPDIIKNISYATALMGVGHYLLDDYPWDLTNLCQLRPKSYSVLEKIQNKDGGAPSYPETVEPACLVLFHTQEENFLKLQVQLCELALSNIQKGYLNPASLNWLQAYRALLEDHQWRAILEELNAEFFSKPGNREKEAQKALKSFYEKLIENPNRFKTFNPSQLEVYYTCLTRYFPQEAPQILESWKKWLRTAKDELIGLRLDDSQEKFLSCDFSRRPILLVIQSEIRKRIDWRRENEKELSSSIGKIFTSICEVQIPSVLPNNFSADEWANQFDQIDSQDPERVIRFFNHLYELEQGRRGILATTDIHYNIILEKNPKFLANIKDGLVRFCRRKGERFYSCRYVAALGQLEFLSRKCLNSIS